jgi:hypothetical protein
MEGSGMKIVRAITVLAILAVIGGIVVGLNEDIIKWIVVVAGLGFLLTLVDWIGGSKEETTTEEGKPAQFQIKH